MRDIGFRSAVISCRSHFRISTPMGRSGTKMAKMQRKVWPR